MPHAHQRFLLLFALSFCLGGSARAGRRIGSRSTDTRHCSLPAQFCWGFLKNRQACQFYIDGCFSLILARTIFRVPAQTHGNVKYISTLNSFLPLAIIKGFPLSRLSLGFSQEQAGVSHLHRRLLFRALTFSGVSG